MMANSKKLSTMLCAGLMVMALGGCTQEGPAERAGEQIDEAIEKAEDKVEKATDR